jgi:hypothetical protein
MPMQAVVRPETVKDALEGLKNLPPKDRAVTRTEALQALRRELKAAQKNGYSVEELATFLKDKGIDVKSSTIRQVLSGSRRDRRETADAETVTRSIDK